MDTTQSWQYNSNFQNHKGNLSEIDNSTILYASNGLSNIPGMQNDYFSSFLGKKRPGMSNEFGIQAQEFKDQTKCFLCLCSTPPSKMVACQNCSRTYHLTCLNREEKAIFVKYGATLYNCFQCRLSKQQMHQINKKHFEFNDDLYGILMRYPPSTGDEDQQHYKMPFISSGRIPEKQLYQMNNKIFLNTIFAQVMNNKAMNNEQRLTYLLKNSNFHFNLHPLILKVLKDRENGYSNSRNADFHLKEIRKKQLNTNQAPVITQAPAMPSPLVQKFPIEDRLLFESSNEYEIDKEIWNRPQGDKIEIEFSLCNKAIIGWDFLVTFNESLLYEDIQFEIRTTFDAFYSDIIIGDKSNELYNKLIIAICHLLVKNLKVLDLNNENKEVYIVKTLIDNSNSTANETFSDCLYEVLRILTTCSTYSSLCNEAFNKVLQKALDNQDLSILNPEERIILLHGMVNLSYETNMIKNTVRTEFEKRASLSNEKTISEENLRNTDKRKREITKNESFDNINNQINDYSTKLDEIKNNNNPLTAEDKKKISEIEKQIQINQSLLKENETLEERRKELIEKIQKTKDALLSLKVPRKKFLGVDYLNNEYYYFNCSVGKLYIKSKSNKQWFLISNREDIETLCKKLTEKGIKERELKSYIKRILHEMAQKENKENINRDTIINSNNKEENDKGEQGTEMDSDKAKIESSTMNNDNEKTVTDNMNIEDIAKTSIAVILIKMERKFSEYLKQFNKEWECPETREKWKMILQETDNEANYISTLKMFNYRFKNPYKSNIEENEEDEEMSYEVLEATEKFVFYDNEGNEVLVIYETDPNKVLSPKVKIWPKEVELNSVDEYYTNELLSALSDNRPKLLLALHFYEDVIFGLIKRRENKKISHNNIMTNLLPVELAKR